MLEITRDCGDLIFIADGACFGWHDDSFEECGKCAYSAACAKAAASSEAEAVRALPKRDEAAIRKLAAEWDAK